MNDVTVVIAYRDMGDRDRRAAYWFVRDWYARLGAAEIITEGGSSPATFGRAAAINDAITRARGRVIVQTDPDNLVDLDVLAGAVALARDAPGLVLPHDRYLRLTGEATGRVLLGRLQMADVDPDRDCEDHGVNASGGVTVFGRDTWQAAGRLDERFGLWGGDDAAFAYACDALVAPNRRLPGPVTHLWHPRLPQSDPTHPVYVDQFTILAEYRDAAAAGPDAVRALVAAR